VRILFDKCFNAFVLKIAYVTGLVGKPSRRTILARDLLFQLPRRRADDRWPCHEESGMQNLSFGEITEGRLRVEFNSSLDKDYILFQPVWLRLNSTHKG
jgi:hypothetical protein